MRSDWKTFTLDDVCIKITDGAHNSPKSVDIGKPMASVKDLTPFGVDLSSARLIAVEEYEKLVKQGCQPEVDDVLIAKDGNSALDTVCVVREPLDAVMLSSVAILRPDENKLDSDYLRYYFSSKSIISYLKRNFISGAAIPRVVLRDFKKAEISLPSLSKQKNIAQVLRSLDDKIELNQKMNQTLEEMAQVLFKSWFVDFDPVHAKATCKSDAEIEKVATELGLSKEVLELFPSEFEESEMGMIPMGWEVSTLEDEFSITMGQSPSGTSYNENKEGMIFFQGRRDFGTYYPTERVYTTEPKRLAKEDDILLSVRAPVGDINIAMKECCIGRGLAVLKHKSNSVSYSYFVMKNLRKIFDGYNTEGTVFGSVNQKTLKSLTVVYDDDIVKNYNTLAEPIFLQMKNQEKEILTLQETRDALLPKLLSGELDVSEVEI